MAGENDVLTRNDNDELAVRVVSTTESSTVVNPNDVYTRDTNGNLAVRTVGAGGGGDQHNLGYFATQSALEEAHPTAEAGDWAIVGATDTVWIWDTDTSAWKDSDQKGQVTSVNNKTGAVVLDASDVDAIPQYSTMPTATAEMAGNIVQFTGTTDANYTNGYFYKCVSDGQNPATYSWTRVDVQPTPNELPDQTGKNGKYLQTNGTTVSWESVESLPSQTGNAGTVLTTDGTDASWDGYLNHLKFANNGSFKQGIGYGTISGYTCFGFRDGNNYFTVGYDVNRHAWLSDDSTPLLGTSDKKWATVYTTKINNGADIAIPTTGGTMALINTPSTMPTLAVADWSNNTQTVNVTGVTATNTVFVSPAPASAADYASAGIVCTAQGAGTLTFTCTTVPSNAITVNVVCL